MELKFKEKIIKLEDNWDSKIIIQMLTITIK